LPDVLVESISDALAAVPLSLFFLTMLDGRTPHFSTSTITGATVNNAKYAYWLECSVDADSSNIVGADVIYNISAANA